MKLTLNLASRIYLNRRKLFLGYAVLGAVLLLVLAAQVNYCYQVYRQTGVLEERLAEFRERLGIGGDAAISEIDTKRLLENIAFANALIAQDSYRWTEMLSRLETVVPDDARLTQIRPDFKKGTLALEGQAKSVETLRRLLDNIFASPQFSDATLQRQSEVAPEAGQAPGSARLIDFSLVVKGTEQ